MKKSIVLLFTLIFVIVQITAFASEVELSSVVATPTNPSEKEYTEKELNNDYRYMITVEVPVSHHGYNYKVTYYFNTKTGEITRASVPRIDSGSYITVPETLAGFPVKGIGREAFLDEAFLCEVILPETIEYIGEDAFKGCVNLFVVKMENPENSKLKRIENRAFNGLERLFEVPLYEGLEYIGDSAFYKNRALTEVTLPESITHVGEYAFYNSGLADVYIPETLSDIGALAFKYTPWLTDYDADFVVEGAYVLLDYKGTATDVVLPNNIYHLPDRAFAAKAITSITFNSRLRTIGDSAFEGCSKLTSVTIPDTVRSVGDNLFKDCTALAEAKLPSHLTEIPPYTFYKTRISGYDLSNITRVGEFAFFSTRFAGELTLKSPMTYVGKDAFASTKITALTVSDDVYLDEAAFGGVTTLASVNIDTTVKQMGGNVFANTPWFKNAISEEYLMVGDGILIAHTSSTYAEELIVPSSVKTVASHAFTSAGGYGKIVLPNSITELGDHALSYCQASSVVLPDSLVKMGKGVFKNSSVSAVDWPKHLTEIPDETFMTSRVSKFDFNGITSIGSHAFDNSYFVSPEIGDSVEKIGDYAFRGGRVKLHHVPAVMGEFPFGNTDTANWNTYPEYYVDPDVFEYNEEEGYVVLPDWVDYDVYITVTPKIVESGENYAVINFGHFPPKQLGAYYGNWGTKIPAENFSWVNENTVKFSDALSYIKSTITFFEHYSGRIIFQYNPLKLIGVGRSDASFTLENIGSLGIMQQRTQNFTTYYLTRCNTTNDSVTANLVPTTGQTFEIYKDQGCTQFNGNTIALSYEPVTVWVKTTSENGKHHFVFPWVLEYYSTAGAPTISPAETHFKGELEVTLSTMATTASIYYTLDGSEPTNEKGILYTAPFTIRETTQVRAIAYIPHNKKSSVVSRTFTRSEDMHIQRCYPSAKYATFEMDPEKTVYEKYLSVLVSTDGVSWSMHSDAYLYADLQSFEVDNLVPNTKYYLKLELPSAGITSNVMEFTTKSYDEATGFSYDERGRICGMPEGDYIEIPETIGGKTVVGITDYACRYVYGTIVIPKTVTMVSAAGMNGSVNFDVAWDNPELCSVDGSLYNKDMTKLIRAGFAGKASNKEMPFVVPSTVKEIGPYALYDTYYNELILNDGLETIRENAVFSYDINLVRIPASVKTIGSNFNRERATAVIFMGEVPGCWEDTFGEDAMLYSAVETTSIYGIPVRQTLDAHSGFTSFFRPRVYNGTDVEASWCTEVDLAENAVIVCRIHYTDGTMKVFAKDASEFQWEGCYFNAGAEVASAKLFIIDKTTLSPLAAEVDWNK